jgi:hypothetical protein
MAIYFFILLLQLSHIVLCLKLYTDHRDFVINCLWHIFLVLYYDLVRHFVSIVLKITSFDQVHP